MNSSRCRHNHAWIIGVEPGYYLWCPDCGAIRGLYRSGSSLDYAYNGWIYPHGQEKAYRKLEKLRDIRNKHTSTTHKR